MLFLNLQLPAEEGASAEMPEAVEAAPALSSAILRRWPTIFALCTMLVTPKSSKPFKSLPLPLLYLYSALHDSILLYSNLLYSTLLYLCSTLL